ncbi:hypothetical protein Pelo_3413 [Pelomyxa schiedti]|nr:hypothetical protein Pelo_3413 [Pelomyxa schiedti]
MAATGTIDESAIKDRMFVSWVAEHSFDVQMSTAKRNQVLKELDESLASRGGGVVQASEALAAYAKLDGNFLSMQQYEEVRRIELAARMEQMQKVCEREAFESWYAAAAPGEKEPMYEKAERELQEEAEKKRARDARAAAQHQAELERLAAERAKKEAEGAKANRQAAAKAEAEAVRARKDLKNGMERVQALSDDAVACLFNVEDKAAFMKLPAWKQKNLIAAQKLF